MKKWPIIAHQTRIQNKGKSMELFSHQIADSLYGIIRGPLALGAFAVFVFGTAFQIMRFVRLTRKIQPVSIAAPTRRAVAGRRFSRRAARRFLLRFKASIVARNPVMVIVTSTFHVCFFGIPVFLLAHNILARELLGVSLCPYVLQESTTDMLSLILLGCVAFFLFRRLFVKRVRAITSLNDYLTLLLASAPFITGLMALHHTFDYYTFIILHMLSAELLLVFLPFSKLAHMIYFFLNRFFTAKEYSFCGDRKW